MDLYIFGKSVFLSFLCVCVCIFIYFRGVMRRDETRQETEFKIFSQYFEEILND